MADVARQLESQPLTPAVVQSVISQLEAKDRATLEWAPQELRAALRPLEEEPLTPERLVDATTGFMRVTRKFIRVLRQVFEQLGTSPLPVLERAWADRIPQVRHFLSEEALDAFEWTWRAAQAIRNLPELDREKVMQEVAEATDEDMESLASSPAGAMIRAQALLSAVSDLVERKGEPERAEELAECASLEAVAYVRLLQASDVEVDPFAEESTSDRAERTRRYAIHLAGEIGDDDLEMIEQARLRDLR